MSGITNLTSNGYYSLKNQSTNDLLTQTNGPTTLAQQNAMGMEKSAATATDSSYSLDLSPQALEYIKSLNLSGAATTPSTKATSLDQFVLTREQQKSLDSIIAKYAGEPFTQATFDQIQDDLKAAGLSPETLAAQDKARNFNPTQFFLDSLNGVNAESSDSSLNSLFGNPETQTTASGVDATAKSTNFMTKVADMWARSSTTVNAVTDAEA